jgi:hypothetical protein
VAAAEEVAAAADGGAADAAAGADGGGGGGGEGGDGDEDSDEGGRDPERVWRREVEETFLRCIRQRFDVVRGGWGSGRGWGLGPGCVRSHVGQQPRYPPRCDAPPSCPTPHRVARLAHKVSPMLFSPLTIPLARQSNVVIELNGLKIAEDRTFADCARYMLTALLGLGLPAPRRTPAEYAPLFAAGAWCLMERWGDIGDEEGQRREGAVCAGACS